MTTLVFSIDPVQGFISQARRTSDGWWVRRCCRSWLRTARAVVDAPPAIPSGDAANVVEPRLKSPLLEAVRHEKPPRRSIDGDTSAPSLPNTVVVNVASPEDAHVLGAHMAPTISEAWRALSYEVWRSLPSSLTRPASMEAFWRSQLGFGKE